MCNLPVAHITATHAQLSYVEKVTHAQLYKTGKSYATVVDASLLHIRCAAKFPCQYPIGKPKTELEVSNDRANFEHFDVFGYPVRERLYFPKVSN